MSQNKFGHILGHVKDLGNDPSNPLTRLYQVIEMLYISLTLQ